MVIADFFFLEQKSSECADKVITRGEKNAKPKNKCTNAQSRQLGSVCLAISVFVLSETKIKKGRDRI